MRDPQACGIESTEWWKGRVVRPERSCGEERVDECYESCHDDARSFVSYDPLDTLDDPIDPFDPNGDGRAGMPSTESGQVQVVSYNELYHHHLLPTGPHPYHDVIGAGTIYEHPLEAGYDQGHLPHPPHTHASVNDTARDGQVREPTQRNDEHHGTTEIEAAVENNNEQDPRLSDRDHANDGDDGVSDSDDENEKLYTVRIFSPGGPPPPPPGAGAASGGIVCSLDWTTLCKAAVVNGASISPQVKHLRFLACSRLTITRKWRSRR